jgi:hypothetical protein
MSSEQLQEEWSKVVTGLAGTWQREYRSKPLNYAWVAGAFVLIQEGFKSELGKSEDDLFREVQGRISGKQDSAETSH